MRLCFPLLVCGLALFALDGRLAVAQTARNDASDPAREARVAALLAPYQWRNLGPNRGGRSIAVAGSAARRNEGYFGATGGGLWKTTDGGTTWRPVTDGQLRSSSVGAVAVAPSNPDVVWLGMGETQLRGNVMQGDGLYRSTDGGVSWSHVGLAASRAISRIRVHPSDPDIAWVAVLGDPFAPSDERGVYRTTDGGRHWTRVLFRSARAGAVDLSLDPSDPHTLYATTWEVYRHPWQLWSGGEGSALYKSTDGGESWTELTHHPGLPHGVWGKVTVAVSPADPRRVWANIEAEAGGLYRSDDGGATWTFVNGHRDLWQRAFYFLRVVPDPRDRDVVYVLSFQLEKSTDGGRTFSPLRTPHADHHDLWIDPNDPQRLISGNDGGGTISVNGGATWTAERYPTAQLYRVTTTDEDPFHACGAQQDNTTVCVPSLPAPAAPPDAALGDWFYEVGGGESADIATPPGAPHLFFAGSTNTLTRFDRRTGAVNDVQPVPRIVMGESAAEMPERWNWTYPVAISRADPRALYVASQHLWRSLDEGRSWRRISGDLTRADSSTLGKTGGPVMLDQDGPEVYATIFSIAPSPRDARVIWTGSDDGLVHVTRDGGMSWRNVTPPDLPAHSRVSRIDASWHRAGTAYLAVERHQLSDRAPYAWKTHDFGATWTPIVQGIATGDFVRVVREDRVRPGLLFAGTEHGVYLSFDDGDRWHSLARNLPDVQVSDLVVERRDLVIATHGRSFWVLDDLSAVRQFTPAMLSGASGTRTALLAPAPAVRRQRPAQVHAYLPNGADSLVLEIVDAQGTRAFAQRMVGAGAGVHRFTWDVRYPGAVSFPGIVLEGGDPRRGVWAPPGRYRAQLRAYVAGAVTRDSAVIEVARDPRLSALRDTDLHAQFRLARAIRDAESAANQAVLDVRELRRQLQQRTADAAPRLPGDAADTLRRAAQALGLAVATVESTLYQVRNQSPKDKIAFPIRLNDRLTGLRAQVDAGDAAPTAAQQRIFGMLSRELDAALASRAAAERRYLPAINAALRRVGVAPVSVGVVVP